MTMTKKDYTKIAALIKENGDYHAIDRDDGFWYLPLDRIVNGLSDIFQEDNFHFDHDRFIAACQ